MIQNEKGSYRGSDNTGILKDSEIISSNSYSKNENNYANSIGLVKAAHYQQPHLDLHCLNSHYDTETFFFVEILEA